MPYTRPYSANDLQTTLSFLLTLRYLLRVFADRCDEMIGSTKHPTPTCPFFSRSRGRSADEQPLPMHERPAMAPDAAPFVAAGKLIKQPGDGSCCFHTLVAGLAQIGALAHRRVV